GAFVEPKDALLYMSKRLLETDLAGDPPAEGGPAATSGGRVEREDSIFTILFVRCPECRKASLPTADGQIELPTEVVERVEPEANKVTITRDEELEGTSQPEAPLPGAQGAPEPTPGPQPEPAPKPVPKAERDRPNPAMLVKKVRLREAGICGNPGCRRRGICHVHHLEYRVNGGKTVLSNSLLLCDCCHSCVHLGLLKIEGNPFTGLVFRRKTIPTLADFQLELKELASVPEIRLEVRSEIDGLGRNGASRRHSAVAESATADSATAGAPGSLDEGLLKALMKIGYSKSGALRRLQLAREKLAAVGGGKEPAEEEILLAAIRG
ncbi:MAG: hypothetical protein HY717_12470, partial [Planctomycetes bacterium]|nr:hypothetical protein [Planctomycetota bacterium]